MNEVSVRAAKLLDQLGAWFDSDQVQPPPYVQHQIDALQECLAQDKRNG